MATERTFVILPGQLYVDQAALFPRVNYARLATGLDLVCNGAVPVAAAAVFDLTLDDVAQGDTFNLPAGLKVGENNVNGVLGTSILAQVRPGVIVVTPSLASDVIAHLTAEVTIEDVDPAGWVALTAAHLQAGLDAPHYRAFVADLLKTGQSDPVPALLGFLTNQIRGYVRTGGKVALGPAGTIPPEAVRDAVLVGRYDLLGRSPALAGSFRVTQDQADKAQERLERFAKDLVPTAPSDAAELSQAPAPRVTDKSSQFDRSSQDGL